jgi:DNA-binding transcriptional regulator YhcF (GntR family)
MFNLNKELSVLSLSEILDYTIRHRILSGELPHKTKFPIITELAKQQKVSEKTVKESYKRLSSAGYIKTVKKSGTFVSFSGDVNVKSKYNKSHIFFQNIISFMYGNGFNRDDIFSCFYNALANCEENPSKVIFVEQNIFDLIQGKEELESILNIPVQGLLLDIYESKWEDFKDRIIVTTFKNFLRVKSVNGNTNIFPLKTTPSLEEFLNFHEIPSNHTIVYIAASKENKKILSKSYSYVKEIFTNFEIIVPEEFDKSLNPNVVIATEKIMSLVAIGENTRKIVLKRFYDNEGIAYIKEKITKTEN